MNNITLLPPGTGTNEVRTLFRQLVAVPAASDPSFYAPPNEAFALGTTRGHARGRNEDRVAVMRVLGGNGNRPWMMFVVCDGIGGMTDGARAAEIAISALMSAALSSRLGATEENLHRSVAAANDAVFAELHGNGGATLSAISWDSSVLATANVGDSRIWAMSDDLQIKQWTQDDNIAAQLKAQGVEGVEDARRDLLQFIGIGKDLKPHLESRKLNREPFVFATSDGAHDVPPEVLGRIVKHAGHSGEVVSRLVDLSLWCGGVDNASVVCFQPNPVHGGAVGVVELWVPGGYFRVVRGETSKPVPQSTSSLGAPMEDDKASELKQSPVEAKKSGKPKTSLRHKSSKREKMRSAAHDEEAKNAANGNGNSEPGHVEIRIGEAEGGGES